MKEKYDLTFAEAQQLISRTNLDTYVNDGDIYIDCDHITQTIGNALQFGMDYQNNKAKEAFGKACGWLSTYPWYQGVVEEFIKAMEE